MHTAAAELQFEVAARIRDEIRELKQRAARHAGRRRLSAGCERGGNFPVKPCVPGESHHTA